MTSRGIFARGILYTFYDMYIFQILTTWINKCFFRSSNILIQLTARHLTFLTHQFDVGDVLLYSILILILIWVIFIC